MRYTNDLYYSKTILAHLFLKIGDGDDGIFIENWSNGYDNGYCIRNTNFDPVRTVVFALHQDAEKIVVYTGYGLSALICQKDCRLFNLDSITKAVDHIIEFLISEETLEDKKE